MFVGFVIFNPIQMIDATFTLYKTYEGINNNNKNIRMYEIKKNRKRRK